LKIFSDTKGWE